MPLRPLVKTHPETGRKSLLVGRHAHNIPGLEQADSDRLIRELVDFACQPPRIPAAHARQDHHGQQRRRAEPGDAPLPTRQHDEGRQRGIVPYRMGSQALHKLAGQDDEPALALARRVKQLLDPDNLISPGRYNL